jgi:uncharacterized protein
VLPRPQVKLLILQGTPFCNIDCRYCYLPQRANTARMQPETLATVVRRLLEDGLLGAHLTVNWHAGEPLVLKPAFYRTALEILQPLSAGGCHVVHSVQTNGTLIDAEWCRLFKQAKIRVGVSVDGPELIHDAFRKTRAGKGTHAQTMAGIKALQDADVPFSVITVLTERSVDHADALYQFYIDHGIRVVGFNIEEIEGAHPQSSIQCASFAERYRRFLERFYFLVRRDGVLTVREFAYFRNRILRERDVTNDQVVPLAILSIDARGNFSTFSPELLDAASARHGDFVFGNVHQSGFLAALTTAKFERVYREISAGVAACRATCEHFAVCRGGAPSNKQFELGSMDTTETDYCRYMKKNVADLVLDELTHEFRTATRPADDARV